ncbi:iron-sulfur cluster assembly scaffold protein [bacterium]|nr:iron-sulfur cluster assembly scaffold protein [bacterium]
MYSDIVRDHFANPRNIGEIASPDAAGSAKNEADGDKVELQLKIKNNIISDVKVKVMGCVAAIASSSMLTEMIKGMKVDEARNFSREKLVTALGGLPEHKIRCSLTCIDALQNALDSFSD